MNFRCCQIYAHDKDIKLYFSQQVDFNVWVVETKKSGRIIIDRYQSHSCPEGNLKYSSERNLVWKNADADDLPKVKTEYAAKQEMKMLEGKYRNHKSCLDSIWYSRVNSQSITRAKINIVGVWADDESRIEVLDGGNLCLVGPSRPDHPFYALSKRGNPDWWDFSRWTLSLGSIDMGGLRFPVYNCEGDELHIASTEEKVLAHIFFRRE